MSYQGVFFKKGDELKTFATLSDQLTAILAL
jgi:hypothetical protein